jgi:hypothetical protein
MKDLEQLPPLDEMADTPPELLEVMRALGREAPSRAALERVARQLGPILDAAPGMPVPTALNTSTLGKFMVARVVVALLAVGGTVYWLQSRQSAPPAASTSPAPVAPAAPLAPAAWVAPAAPAAESVAAAAPEPVGGMVAQPVLGAADVRTDAHAPRPHAPRAHARGRAPVRVEPVQGVAAPLVTAPASVAEPPAASVEPVAPPAAQPAKEREPAAPGPDEFALLWRARQRLASDPAGALALLQTHATRFAEGQLAPEREVLAVEALRALGRKEEAERKLQAFRKRYPGSIHLRRLQQGD